jgi:ribonuclease P protein component
VTRVHQKDFSTQQPEAQTAPRVPLAHGDQKRPEDLGLASRQGPQASERLGRQPIDQNPGPIAVERLRVRREFLYVAEGYSERRRLLVVQGRRRFPVRDIAGEGFTTTKKVGGSVVRNRARRRLREASRLLLPLLGVPGADYVFIARQETGTAPWPRLLDDMETALISLRRRFQTDGAPNPAASATPSAEA